MNSAMEDMKPSLDEARAWIALIAEKGWPDEQVVMSLAAKVVVHRLEGVMVVLAAVREREASIAALEATLLALADRMILIEERDAQVAKPLAAKVVRHRLEGVTAALDAVREHGTSLGDLEMALLASVYRS